MSSSLLNLEAWPKASARVCAVFLSSASDCRLRRRSLICEGSASTKEDRAAPTALLFPRLCIPRTTAAAAGAALANSAEAPVGHSSRSVVQSVRFRTGSRSTAARTRRMAGMSSCRVERKSKVSAVRFAAGPRPLASSSVCALLMMPDVVKAAHAFSARVLSGGLHTMSCSGCILGEPSGHLARNGHVQFVRLQGSDFGPSPVPFVNCQTLSAYLSSIGGSLRSKVTFDTQS
mmetsp:Transcript_39277/g.111033  ORF Transcript_39277/g.111033 Transcript_39277/m.111033 type:complete len:232 (-) Transcript_39277:169-864(-)